ncbi:MULTISPECIES: PspC domain-containing protein [Exiguobacterium]|jgi:phage shock protein C|uniref:Phage shock protein C, PspC n=2 Tax=Exiguobacterium TaxID=33986 RepID=C4L2I2_EXISA|nr:MULTISPECIES: PspC domain-containing protein [Exiguobacterium]MCC9626211.1 PspC domain-containing protein [Thalassospira sp. MA62]ACQ71234.1 phage shock protein C, PspC [Exiguobacterium sp. AT1b]MBQ6460366.1 PspC domain-containing protein [Exiguobacterium sp.]MBR2077878.1 PspC domain-containing protein [Exiguobacterium sp.]MCM3281342.1 PspC domain-containing protein [Exiguobacterium sp. MER 193]
MERKLYKDPNNKVIAGVCSGLGNYLGVDVTIMRVLFVAMALLGGPGLLIYIILALIMKKPVSEYEAEQDDRF